MSNKKQQEFIEAYNTYADAIFRHCYLRVFQRELAQDLMQQAFVRTWEYVVRGNEVKNYRLFLYRVATNLIIDHSRKHKTVSLEVLQEKGLEDRLHMRVDMRKSLHDHLESKEVVEKISRMDPKYREVLLMHYIDGFSPKEIAEFRKESENTIYIRLHRGLKKLRTLLFASEHKEAPRELMEYQHV